MEMGEIRWKEKCLILCYCIRLQNIHVPLRNIETLHLLAKLSRFLTKRSHSPQKIAFARKILNLLAQFLRFLTKLLHSQEKHCLHLQNLCVFWKTETSPKKTLHLLPKLFFFHKKITLSCKTLAFPEDTFACACKTSARSCKMFAFSCKTSTFFPITFAFSPGTMFCEQMENGWWK